MSFKLCSDCNQYHLEDTCPHCETKTSSKLPIAALMGLALIGCDTVEEAKPVYGVEIVDVDSDGWSNDEDCDDADPNTYPGIAIEDSESACMQDFDGDGYGNASPENENVEAGTDCDDSDPTINPGAGNCEEDSAE